MKNSNLLNRLWADSHEKQSPQRFGRYAAMLIMLLTLGVGQMWANSGISNCYFTYNDGSDHSQNQSDMTSKDLGTLSSDLTIKAVYLKVWDDSYDGKGRLLTDAQLCYTKNNWTNTSYVGSGSWTRGDKSGNDYELQKSSVSWTLVSLTEGSGNYTMKYYWQAWGDGDKYLNNGGSNYTFTYTIAPPDVSDFTVTPSGSIHGDGSSGNPYIVIPGNDLTLTLSGATKAHTDANSVAHYSVDGSSYGTGNTTKVITNVTNTSSLSVTVYAKFYNSSADLNGEIKSKTIYYKADPQYTVRATYGAGGTSATPASATTTGQYQGRSISASAALGYYFTGWTVSSGSATFADAGSASTTVYPSANATVQANFSPIWYLKGAFDSWSETHPISLASSTSGSVDLTTTTAKLTNQEFKIWNKQTNTYYQIANKAIDRDHPTPSGSWTSGGTGNGMRFTSDIITTYTFAITYSSNIPSGISVTYPPAYTVTFGQGTGYGTAVTASATSAGGSFSSGDYVAAGEDVTFTQSAATGYTFKEWNTQADGNGEQLGTDASLTLSSIGENKNVYAIYTPNVYRITFDYQNAGAARGDGDRFSDVGSTLVDGSGNRYIDVTYGEIVSGTMPKAEKDGYVFGGWYVDQAATDKKPIDENGSWRTITGYTDTDKKWIHAGDVTLYARFWAPSILSISFSPAHAEPQADVTATISFNPFLSHPGPEGNYTLCYTLTTAAGVPLRAQPEWRNKDDATYTVTFKAPSSPGDYSLLVKLFAGTGDVCGGNSPVATFQGGPDLYKFDVEDMNPVTVTYECGGVELLPSTTVYATWNNRAHITPPSIAGMKFDHWEYTNCTIVGGSDGRYNEQEAEIYAFTAGSVKAVYTQGSLFFKNTKNWDHVYVYFYRSNYWYTKVSDGESEGTGSNNSWAKGANKVISGPLEMTLLEGTDDVFFYNGEVGENYAAVAFSDESMPNYDYFSKGGTPCQVVYVNTFDANKPMIVPVGNGAVWNNGMCKYYAHDLAPLLQDWGATVRSDIDSWVATHRLKSEKMGDLSFSTKIYFDRKSYNQNWRVYDGSGSPYGKNGIPTLTYNSPTSATLINNEGNLLVKTNLPGEYIFTINYDYTQGSGAYDGATATTGLWKCAKVTVTYPVEVGDYRLIYDDSNLNPHPSDIIKKKKNSEAIVSMFYDPNATPVLKVQSCTAVATNLGDDVDPITWSTPTTISLISYSTVLTEAGVYNFTITLDENGTDPRLTNVEKYTGRFYVRTNCVNGDKWNYKDSKDAHAMTYSDYSTTLTDKPYSHYYVKDIDGSGGKNVNIRFTVATDYSEAITDTVFNGDAAGAYKDMWGNETLTQKMNVRFTYNQKTNKIWRAYTEGPQLTGYMTLRCDEEANPATDPVIYKSVAGVKGDHQDTLKFVDMGNWVYQLDAYGDPNVYVKLTANIHNSSGAETIQYLKGKNNATYDESNAVLLIGGSGEAQHMRITYDFKTERMTTAWLPSGTVTSDLSIHADVMLLRKHQQGATSIVIGKKDASNYAQLSDVEKAYGVMEFEKSYINNTSLSRYERNLYWISFPFNVKLSDVFGFGKYGQHWIIEYYDGKGRAQKGYWADSEPNWKYVTEEVKDEFELKANEGYILALALSNMGDGSSVWEGGKISSVYLYFPSKDNIGNITNVENFNMPLDSVGYKCNITRDHRNVKDSYWHCIGVPSFALNSLTGVSTTVPGDGEDWSTPLPYVYKWDSVYNTLSIASTSTFKFEAMKSYLIQYANDHISWANVTNKASVVARRRVEGNKASFYEWNLNLLSNGQRIDHTYVRLSNDENVTDGYDFGNDLSKEFNSGSNIYTFVDDVEVAGNVKPIRTETTIVPVGVKIATTGEYTFSMPEGTNGVGVVLVDNNAGTRTNLALEDYTVNLAQGNIDGRFLLEISPIAQTPTDMENVQGDDVQTNVRKVMVDGILYIVKDGIIYDALGNRVK